MKKFTKSFQKQLPKLMGALNADGYPNLSSIDEGQIVADWLAGLKGAGMYNSVVVNDQSFFG